MKVVQCDFFFNKVSSFYYYYGFLFYKSDCGSAFLSSDCKYMTKLTFYDMEVLVACIQSIYALIKPEHI